MSISRVISILKYVLLESPKEKKMRRKILGENMAKVFPNIIKYTDQESEQMLRKTERK